MVKISIIDQAFSDQPILKKAIADAVAQTPQHTQLFHSIAQYVVELRSAGDLENGPATKKRRIDDLAMRQLNINNNDAGGAGTIKGKPNKAADGPTLLTVGEISFSVPQRKKLTLEFFGWGVRAVNPGSGMVEFGVRYGDIQHAACLPVPEKTQRQFNFCIFPPGSDGITLNSDATSGDAIVFTIPDGPPKTASGPEMQSGEDVTYKSLLMGYLNKKLLRGRKVVEPNEKLFASALVQNHRKGEKAVHVKAFRGSKDGYLFFLPTGILWAFKKPLVFFSFDVIDSTSYTSVLQRTFNLNIATRTTSNSNETATQEFEFSMVDQADFAGIDGYIRGHKLQDASMAEQRRAKKLNVNGVKSEEVDNDVPGHEEGESELAKAVREMEDAEDEEDEEDQEDYDPGSEGKSEGSGESSDEDSDDDGEDDEEEEEGDLVEEELGSEAEDVDDEVK